MPGLDTKLHLKMLKTSKTVRRGKMYGLEWGDPEESATLKIVKEHYLMPFVLLQRRALTRPVVVEIGPGGGRWTRYIKPHVERVYAVDYHAELLAELGKNVRGERLVPIKNNGDDFPGIPEGTIDFIFSFGTFVHLDFDIIEKYIVNLKPLLKPTSNVVIQYSDMTKPRAQMTKAFSDNRPSRMLPMIERHGYAIEDDNRWLLPHSAIVRFTLAPQA